MFQNYQVPFRKDRITNSYGGVIVYVKGNIPCKRRLDLEIVGVECIWLELTLRNKTVLFSVFYRSPNSPAQTLVDIENTIGLAFDTNIGNIIVTGDFNLNWLDSGSKRKVSSVSDQYNLAQLIREPTHFTENSSSLIDLIFTKMKRLWFLVELVKHFWIRIYDIIALSSQCLVSINASNHVLGGGYGSMMKLTMYFWTSLLLILTGPQLKVKI